MLAILDESLPSELEAGGPASEAVLAALAICAQQVREGTHLLFAERTVYRRLKVFHNRLDNRTAAILAREEDRLPQLGQLRDFVVRAIRIVVSPQPTVAARIANGKRIEICLPVTAIEHQSSLLGLPMLLVENLNDGRCYLKLAKSIIESGVMPELGWLKSIATRYDILPGGGHTLSALFDYHKGQGSRLGLAIADSDERYPGSAPGATAAALVRIAIEAPVSPLLEYQVLPVRSIENCIPRAEIRKIAEELDPVQLSRFECLETNFSTSPHWKLIPIKAGIRCFELGQVSAESKFWTTLLGERTCLPNAHCKKKTACPNYAIPPISNQILEKAVERLVLFTVTERCMDGLAETWKQLIVLLYSLFCSSKRVTVF